MARPQIYVHPCLDLVPPQSMGSLLRSLWRERRGVWSEEAGVLVELDLMVTIGRTVREREVWAAHMEAVGGLFGGADRMSVSEGAVSDLPRQQLRAQTPSPADQSGVMANIHLQHKPTRDLWEVVGPISCVV